MIAKWWTYLDRRRRLLLAGWTIHLVVLMVVGRLFADKVQSIAESVEEDRRAQVAAEMETLHAKLSEVTANQVLILEGQQQMLEAQIEELSILRGLKQ